MPEPAPNPRGSAVRAIAFLAVASFAAQAMVRVTDSLLPQIAADLGVTVGAASIVVTAYLLAHGSVQLVVGPIGDRVGKYRYITVAAAGATVFVALCGMATSLPMLVTARLFTGVAAGAIIPLALAFVGDVIPYERRQQVIGSFLSGQILGQLFGQAAGGVLGDLFGWRNVFFVLAALLAIATVGLVVELFRNPVTRWTPPVGQEKRGHLEGYRLVLGSPWARAILVAAFIEFGLIFGAFTYVGADLHHRFGVGFTTVGLFVGFFAIGGLVYSLSVRWLVRRFGPTGLAASGGAVLAGAFVMLAFEPVYWTAPAAILLTGLGFYMLHNTMQTNATQMTPEARGTAVGLFSSALYIGQTVGVAAGGIIFDRFTAVPVFLIAGSGLLVLGLWFARALKRRAMTAG